ncbi:MAG: SDR family NAD(P)-dependent oxidoreductase [Acidimicrobiia bacterium]|nr:SDR family NAD(P)-dependent oxidoreductase [Acidimicrobiia bacterium]
MDLDGRVAIITGASRGIGKGLALGLAAQGARIVCAARSVDASATGLPGTIHDTVAEIEAAGGHAMAVRCDIGEAAEIEHLIATAAETYGRIDVLINNAMAQTRTPFVDATPDDWDESMRVNVRSLFVSCHAVIPHMVRAGGGSIINVSSGGAGHEATPFMPPGYVIYATAKAAMERFSTALAPELRELGITINALRPGAVKTELSTLEMGPDHDWTGWTTPAAVVPAAAYLAQQIGTDFTGHVVDSTQFGTSWP